jgi:two-component system KDP operon response regulator KdpE
MDSAIAATRRVLIIDDDSGYGWSVCRFLRRDGYEAHHALTAAEGLEQVKARPPDMILLDIHLPDIDGIALYKAFKAAPQTRDIPVILMTGEAFIDNVLKAISAGLNADAVYQKGDFDMNALMERVRRALSDARGGEGEPAEPSTTDGILRRGPVVVDLVRREVRLPDTPIMRLATRPFELLVALLRQDGPVSQHDLRRQVWPDSADSKVVGVTMVRLRRDLETAKIMRIETIGDAYQLVIGPAQKF